MDIKAPLGICLGLVCWPSCELTYTHPYPKSCTLDRYDLLTHHINSGAHSFCGAITNAVYGSLVLEAKEERAESKQHGDSAEASRIDLYGNTDCV